VDAGFIFTVVPLITVTWEYPGVRQEKKRTDPIIAEEQTSLIINNLWFLFFMGFSYYIGTKIRN